MTIQKNYGPQEAPDASYGLIYRLNSLWVDVDQLAFHGNFSEWNTKLDRIFSNLLFKNPMDYELDEDGNIINVELSEKDRQLYESLNKEVMAARRKMKFSIKTNSGKGLIKGKEQLYQALLKKEYALRKMMYDLGLYLKKTDSNPSKAMWGG